MERLKTGVLGLNENGLLLLQAASELDCFVIEAVADKDTRRADTLAAQYNCAAYDDYRQFIIQNQFDCLLIAAGLHNCDEYVRAAIRKKTHILKLAPPARNFEEAVELLNLTETNRVNFAAAVPLRFCESFQKLAKLLEQNRLGEVFLITGWVKGHQQFPAWRNDRRLAGGGILLYECYELIEQMISSYAVPEKVYALATSEAADRQKRCYLTEDVTAVSMKFSETCFGNLVAINRKELGPERVSLTVYGTKKTVEATRKRFVLKNRSGRTEQEAVYENDRKYCFGRALENFALAISNPDKYKHTNSLRKELESIAVIDSAYLSARTGFPEEPLNLLQIES